MKNPILALLFTVKDIISDISITTIEVLSIELLIIYILNFRRLCIVKEK